MEKEELYEKLIPKDRNLDEIAAEAIKNSEIISYLLEGLEYKNARTKFGCFNTLVLVSERTPELLYPYFDSFAEKLDSDNNFFKLGAIRIIANLSKVDSKNKFDRIFDTFYSFIADPAMTTAANVVKGSPIIAKAKPYMTEKIVNQLLSVSKNKYKTSECKNILLGQVIVSFEKFFMQIKDKNLVLDFVKSNADSNRKATQNKAQKFLKKYANAIA